MSLIDLEIHGSAAAAAGDDQTLLILKEKGGERILPILTSTKRATQLLMRKMLPVRVPVALTATDALHLLMRKMNIRMVRVEMVAVMDGQFFAKIYAEQNGQEFEGETCLAADGLVIATTFGCRLSINEELLEAQYMRKVGENAYAMNINSVSRSMLEDALRHAVDAENYEVASKLKAELDKRKGAAETD